ncbi:probable phosphoglycerate mutase [Rhodobacter sp. JA431]|uniref:histidine phosphatase family protein n=1 Tax=Rhodobacter sp. JA431 TaxID=570013 RepID=UPI000BD79F51|nr:histidine phosphatase family protein [Rhodobacter sp. JA431]SOC00482.1 probable phosphoglycerate mutase [Rhodobacter sp. JA431]
MVALPPGAFWLMRHGETAANAQDIICGQTDLPLSARGRAQADQAAAFLADLPLARIVTSSLLRARQTAQALAARCGLVPEVIEDLAERNWGALEGQPRSALRREETPPGGEAPAAFRARIRAGFAQIDRSKPVLIVAHSGTAREIHALLSQAPHRRLWNAETVLWQPDREVLPNTWHCHDCFKPAG